MYKYKVLVEGQRIDHMDFDHPEDLPECQLAELAYAAAKSIGLSSFGTNGVRIMRVREVNGA